MKLYAIFASLMFAAVSAESKCGEGYWSVTGEKPCNFACSPGCADSCNIEGGKCIGDADCKKGWEDSEDSGRCDSPVCTFERNSNTNGCANGGKCIAPQTCICGQSGAQIVAKSVSKADGTHEGTDCVSLRRDGIIGSFIALCVMTVSVSFCAITERHLTKKKNAAKSA